MNRDRLQTAIAEAERFLSRAKIASAGFTWTESPCYPTGGYWHHDHAPDVASAKRASMDLTRALADLRKAD